MGINKIQYGNTTLIDLTSDTVTADKLMQGYTAHDRSGAVITGTATGGGTGAISVVDTTDTHGGTIRTITAVDISDTTAVANDVAQGKYFYTADGTKTAGTSSGGGGGLEYETGTWTPTADIARPTISFTSTHTERPIYVLIFDISEEVRDADDMLAWTIVNWYDAFGVGLKVANSQTNYARTQGIYKTASSFGAGTNNVSSLNGNSGTTEMGYFLTKTAFYPYGGASTRYWRAGRTYKWIAVWTPTT